MKDQIQDRLNKITGLDERRALKKILLDVYENVVDYNMVMYDQLEKRIYDEIEDPLDKFYVYTCLDDASNIDPISSFLHPMIPADLEEVVYDMNEINKKLKSGTELILTSIFMKCDYLTLKGILDKKRNFKGFIKTDVDIHEINIKLRLSQKYINEIERLYRIFQFNAITWNTINSSYAYKFIDIILNSSLELNEGENIKEITIDLAEYERYKVVNVVPLWNIKNITVTDKSFPMPAIDRINYEHKISVLETGEQNGYLATLENSDFIYSKRYDNDFIIISTNSEQQTWDLIQIESISNLRKKNFKYELLSNKRNLGFIGRYASLKSVVIRTKAEIARLLQSYDLNRELAFKDVQVIDSYDKEHETTNFNSFVDDNIRKDSHKKIMLVKFKPEDRENYLIQDKMSFLVSELQILFPEYKCIGELL